MHALLDAAVAAARAGREEIIARLGQAGRVHTKTSAFDFASEADIAAGVAAVKAIAERLEDARFVVEEPEVYAIAGVAQGSLDDGDVWVIDPIDGTTSFLHGYPCFSTSVALLRDGQPVAAAVHNVPANETTTALAGEGSWLDGTRLAVAGAAEIADGLFITGFPYDRTVTLDRQLGVFNRIVRVAHDVRRDGSAAIDCCHVAAGRADGFWEFGLNPWDVAAGVLAIREAGGVVTDVDGSPWTPHAFGIVAANPTLHARLLEIVLG